MPPVAPPEIVNAAPPRRANKGASGAAAPTLCMVHNAVGTQNAIAKVAMSGVREALSAGWRVTVVADELDESLRGEVEWLPLYVPPRLFLVQWLVARPTIRAAMRGRTFDVLHVHQAQVAALADVMQCHFLTRRAWEQDCLESRPGFGPAVVRAQQLGVLRAEDFYYRHWNPRTRMLFNSERTRQDFHRLYGAPTRERTFLLPVPPIRFADDAEQTEARRRIFGEAAPRRLIVGFLGGVDERKGYRRAVKAVADDGDLFLLMGGLYSETFTAPELGDRLKTLGKRTGPDLDDFYAACDVVVVPSLYEPFGLVATEAAARGVPVLASPEVGALPHLLGYGAGTAWPDNAPLGPLAREAVACRDALRAGARRMGEDLSERRQGEALIGVYNEVLQEKRQASGRNG